MGILLFDPFCSGNVGLGVFFIAAVLFNLTAADIESSHHFFSCQGMLLE